MQKDIATLLRWGHDAYCDGKGVLSQSLMDRIRETYDDRGTVWEDGSKHWRVFKREEYSVPHFLEEENESPRSSFIYMYFNDLPRTFYMGEWSIGTLEAAHSAAPILQRMVLDQEGHWPPKWLNSGSSHEISDRILLYYCLGTFLTMGEGIREAGNQSGPLYSAAENFAPHLSVFWPILPFAAMGLTVAVVRGGTALGNYLGRKADKIRLREIPKDAYSLLFGSEAIDAINAEHEIRVAEARKIKLYNELKEGGMDITKEAFLELFDPSIEIDPKENERLLEEYRKMSDIPKSIN